MAVQILNDMPDAAIHRGDPEILPGKAPSTHTLSDWSPRATRADTGRNRPWFIAAVIGGHVLLVLGFLSVRHIARMEQAPAPLVAEILAAPLNNEELPAIAPPPMHEVVYSLPTPEVVSIELDTIAPPPVTAAISQPIAQTVEPPMVESVEYVRAPAPVYPRESSRRNERGTVLLRVLVDSAGRPAQIQIERSSGYTRLDSAAREAVQKAMFRPHEVNGVAQAAQVLIPIEFMRRAS
jgi:periplasmic protein TonB